MRLAKTAAQRQAELRANRAALGMKRLELHAHPEDWPAIKALAERLRQLRSLQMDYNRAIESRR